MAASVLVNLGRAGIRDGLHSARVVTARARHTLYRPESALTPKERLVADRLCFLANANKEVIFAPKMVINVTDRDSMQPYPGLDAKAYTQTVIATLKQGFDTELASFTTTKPPYTHMGFADRLLPDLLAAGREHPYIRMQTVGVLVAPSAECFQRAMPFVRGLVEGGFNVRVNFMATADTKYAKDNIGAGSVGEANKRYLGLIQRNLVEGGLLGKIKAGVFVSGMPNGVDSLADTREVSFATMSCFRDVLGPDTLFFASSTRGCYDPDVFGRFLIQAKEGRCKVGVHAHYDSHKTAGENVFTISHQFAMARVLGVDWVDSSTTGQGHSLAGKPQGGSLSGRPKELTGNVHTALYQALVVKTSHFQVTPAYFEQGLLAARGFSENIGGEESHLQFLLQVSDTRMRDGLSAGVRLAESLLEESSEA